MPDPLVPPWPSPFIPEILIPKSADLPRIPSLVESLNSGKLASDFHDRLVKWIHKYEATLDPDTEVGARLVSFGQTIVIHLTGITYWDPALIRFDGVAEDGRPVQLVQHVTQISVLLTSVAKQGASARRIGFIQPQDEKTNEPS